MPVTFEIYVTLIGISASTCLIFFAEPGGRRILMAFGLVCAICLILFALIGVIRTAALGLMIYWAYEWHRSRRANAELREGRPAAGD